MSDDRIERALRQRGPREPGAHLAPLPADAPEAKLELRALERRRSPLRFVGLGVGTVLAAGVAVVAVLAVVSILPRQPVGVGGPSSTAEATAAATVAPTPTPTTAAPVACAASALHAQSEAWGGGAGSRGATVTVTNIGASACTLHGNPGAEIRDAGGAVLVAAQDPDGGNGPWSAPGDPTLTLAPGASATTSVRWSNWCAAAPQGPLTVSLILGDGALEVQLDPGNPDVIVPPCNGAQQPSSLSTIAFESP